MYVVIPVSNSLRELWCTLLDFLLERHTDLFQDRQMLLEERTTEWSHCVSRLLCHEDPLWSYVALCGLSGALLRSCVVWCGPFWCLVVPLYIVLTMGASVTSNDQI